MSTTSTKRLGSTPSGAVKEPVVAATTANITLTGEQTIDSVSVVAGDRVLVRLQTDATENGVYDCSTGAWTRSTDWNAADDIVDGQLVFDSNGNVLYSAVYAGTYDPDTTSLTFVQYNASFYLGAFASAPVLDNDGNALVAGEQYFNTAVSKLYIYTGSAWTFAGGNLYLGAFASAPTVDNEGAALVAGQLYFNTAVDKLYVRTSAATWTLATATAADVALVDAGLKYDATDVEAAFAELASTTAGQGASIIGLADAGSKYDATDVEAAFAELASTTAGQGASIIGVENADNFYSGSSVEAALTSIIVKAKYNPTFSATCSATTSSTPLAFNTEAWDYYGDYDNATNYRFTPSVAGMYRVTISVGLSVTTGGTTILSIRKNGTAYRSSTKVTTSSTTDGMEVTALVYFNGSTDYVDAAISGGTVAVTSSASSYFEASYAGQNSSSP